jgi:hypothetical protein
VTPPRPSGFGPLSWLWWPVLLGVLWPLAGLSLLLVPRDGPVRPRGGGKGRRNGFWRAVGDLDAEWLLWGLGGALSALMLLGLAACHPRPTVPVANPFWPPAWPEAFIAACRTCVGGGYGATSP